jgi:hypothetical protein
MLLIATLVPTVTSVHEIAVPPIVRDDSIQQCSRTDWSEQQKLLAGDGANNDNFGWSVSLNDDTALVGAPGESASKGSAYVYIRTGDTWMQQQQLSASDGTPGDEFGGSVSLDGDTALIGAPYDDSGSAYIFTRSGTTWTQQAKLLPSDGTAGNEFGFFVSLSGDTALIGAVADNDLGSLSGSAYVFTRTGTIWSQQQKLLANDGQAYDRFGFTVSLQGDTALIGAIFGDGIEADTGAVYAFTRTGVSWIQQQKIFASDSESWDIFGHSVSLDGDTAVVGARFDEGCAGSAYVFTFSGTTWTQQQKLTASDPGVYDSFGVDVSLDGNTALIGAEDEISSDSSGAAYVFTRSGTVWTEQAKLLPSDGEAWDWFGGRVSLSDGTALIGAAYDDDNGIDSGSAYLFHSTQTQNQPPYVPNNPSPSNGMIDVDVNAMLSWVGGDPDPDDTVTYDVYFGTNSNPPKVIGNQSSNSYNEGTMQYSTTYYWRIVAWDNHEARTTGPLWYFTTMAEPNQPPYIRNLSGPSTGKIGVEYRFSADVVDPDGDTISCVWDWGDGTTSDWQGPYANGTTINASHTWAAEGIFEIKVQPRDQHGLLGDWSTPRIIAINQSLTTTFIFGKYTNLTTEGNYIIIQAVDLRMFTFAPFQYLHQIAGQKITFSKDNMKAALFPRVIIGFVNILL